MSTVIEAGLHALETPAPRRRRRVRPGRWLLPIWGWLVIAWLSSPIIVMIIFGFNNTAGKFNIKWQGFTLRWYRELFAIPDLTSALENSITIALIVTAVATVVVVVLAIVAVIWAIRVL